MFDAESQVERLFERSRRRGGSRTRAARADRRTRPDPGRTHCEVSRVRWTTAGRPAIRHGPGARRERERGNPLAVGRTAHRSKTPIAERRTEDGFGKLAGTSETTEPATMDRAARAPPSLRTRAGRGTAGGEQAAVMRYGCRRGANLRRVERQWERRTRPEKLRLRRPIRRKPGEPRPGTGCNMPEVVNGGNRRGGEKPRGRSETGGVAAVGRWRISVLREWTFTRPSGDGESTRDEVPGEEGSRTTRSASRLTSQRDPARLGEDAEGEAEVGGGVTDT